MLSAACPARRSKQPQSLHFGMNIGAYCATGWRYPATVARSPMSCRPAGSRNPPREQGGRNPPQAHTAQQGNRGGQTNESEMAKASGPECRAQSRVSRLLPRKRWFGPRECGRNAQGIRQNASGWALRLDRAGLLSDSRCYVCPTVVCFARWPPDLYL